MRRRRCWLTQTYDKLYDDTLVRCDVMLDVERGDAVTTFAVIDLETTGLDPAVDRVVEAASVRVNGDIDSVVSKNSWMTARAYRSSMYDPGRGIPAEASAVHHLIAADVFGCEAFGPEAWSWLTDGIDVMVAHNTAFDRAFVPWERRPWICTWKAALRVWPDAPGHSNQVLRYHLPGVNEVVTRALPADLAPHRAAYDAITTAHLLIELLKVMSPSHLVALTDKPALLPRVTFGKHRGQRWAEVPRDYLEWVLRQTGAFDENVRYTAHHYLAGATR